MNFSNIDFSFKSLIYDESFTVCQENTEDRENTWQFWSSEKDLKKLMCDSEVRQMTWNEPIPVLGLQTNSTTLK